MKCLVTGGAGFIGSAVCRYLITCGYTVVNLDKPTYAANLDLLATIAAHPQYKFYRADICDRDAVASVFAREQPDAVMHLAAELHVDRSIGEPAEFITTNVVGTYQLLEAARDYFERLPGERADQFRFLHVSTDEVYGASARQAPSPNRTPYDPKSPYSASKASSDHLVRAWHSTYGLPVLMTNSSNNYGPYQFPEKLIPLIIIGDRREDRQSRARTAREDVTYLSASSASNTNEPKSVVAEFLLGKDAIGGGGRVTGTEMKAVALTQSFHRKRRHRQDQCLACPG